MFDYKLSLIAGTDIPIPECQITVHQPIIKEIALLGETSFLTGVQLLCLNKNMYVEDTMLDQTTNFQIFITMVNEPSLADKKENVLAVLGFLLPKAQIIFTSRAIVVNNSGSISNIDEENFEFFQKVLRDMFCLEKSDQDTFNPQGNKAKEIADKLMKARKRVANQAQSNSGSMFGQYLSILTVGLHSMTLNDCLELTMYQLYDLVERYMLYINWDIDIRSRMAGAKGDKPVENWMKQIH